ncbi:MAG: thiamine-phosphate kinase [Deltaproteobacteria bacterium]|nr:thiamine-phosphate kinase [Candidatus Anaeroferrophillacea bacterium]
MSSVPSSSAHAVGERGEFDLIARIAAHAGAMPVGVRVGIGDDAAVITCPAEHELVVTTDMLVEGRHFDRRFTTAADLGAKSLAVNLSDAAAMGAVPRHVFLGLGLPPACPCSWVDDFLAGFLAAAAAEGVVLLGGDTVAAGEIIVSVTLHGYATVGSAVRRRGARPGDDVYVSGTIGDSSLGLELLRGGFSPAGGFCDHVTAADREFLVRRHNRPTPRVRLGCGLAADRLVTAMIDLSDGLAGDAAHLTAGPPAVGVLIEESALPLSPAFCRTLVPADPRRRNFALRGGEDYELLFTAPPAAAAAVGEVSAAVGVPVRRVGRADDRPGVRLRRCSGEIIPLIGGFDHFAAAGSPSAAWEQHE